MFFIPGVLHDDTVTIKKITTGRPDADGIASETIEEIPWAGVNVQQVRAENLTDQDRNTSRAWYRVSGPTPAAGISSADRILWGGAEYRIDGEPDTRSGAYRINHTSIRIYRAEG